MRFKGIEAVDSYGNLIVYWADLSDMPEAVQDRARKIDRENCKGQRFGVCVGYNFTEKEFFIYTDKNPVPPAYDGNVYYFDTDDDFHWLQVEIGDELTALTKQIFNACDHINTGIDTPQGYTIQKTVQFRDGTGSGGSQCGKLLDFPPRLCYLLFKDIPREGYVKIFLDICQHLPQRGPAGGRALQNTDRGTKRPVSAPYPRLPFSSYSRTIRFSSA